MNIMKFIDRAILIARQKDDFIPFFIAVILSVFP